MGAAYVAASDMVKAQSGPQTAHWGDFPIAPYTQRVAKAIVVRKSVARKGVRVRVPVIPKILAPEKSRSSGEFGTR